MNFKKNSLDLITFYTWNLLKKSVWRCVYNEVFQLKVWRGVSSLTWFVWAHVAATITLWCGTKQPSRHRLQEVVSARLHLNPEAVCFQCDNPTSRANRLDIWKQAAKHCFSVLTIWSLIFMYCCLCAALFKVFIDPLFLSFISSQIYSQFSRFVVTVVMTMSLNAKCDQHAWGSEIRV